MSIIVVFCRYCQSQFVLNTKEIEENSVTKGAVEEKVASKLGVQGSNPGRDCPVCEIFRMAKTDDSYVKIPTETDQNDEKKRKGFDRFWRSKSDKNRRFLMFKSEEFLNTGFALCFYMIWDHSKLFATFYII